MSFHGSSSKRRHPKNEDAVRLLVKGHRFADLNVVSSCAKGARSDVLHGRSTLSPTHNGTDRVIEDCKLMSDGVVDLEV